MFKSVWIFGVTVGWIAEEDTNVCLIICDEYAQFYDLLRLLFWQPKSRGKKRK